jgi:checkpoint serine/threonine-protein kinase
MLMESAFQGLCLVDWGRGIDLKLFPTGTEFCGDSGTSGFSCIEMQEERNWTYQVCIACSFLRS